MQLYLSESQRRRYWLRFRIKVYSFLCVAALAAVGSVYFIRQSGFFQISKVEIPGLSGEEKRALSGEIESLVLARKLSRFLGAENFLSWPGEMPVRNLAYARVNISRDFSRREILISAERRDKLGIWCIEPLPESEENKQCFWFDKDDGILMDRSPGAEGQLVFAVNETSGNFPMLGESVLAMPLFKNFKAILEGVKALGLSIVDMRFDRKLEELTLTAAEGARLIFSLRFDPALNAFPALRDLFIKNPLASISYLDLTVENKIYLKSRQ